MSGKVRVCFVDDEENILLGLKRFMRTMNAVWETSFFASAGESLAHMEHHGPFDVVVSDMRMPQMNGAQLLARVQNISPATIRIILSGYADPECVFQTVGPAHIYLAKPCEPEILRAAIERPLALRRLLNGEGLLTALGGMSNLPSLPELFAKLNAELRSPRASSAAVAEIVARDMAMTAEILKLTNSAYFALPSLVTTPFQAVRTLGLENVQALVLKIGIFRQYEGSQAAAPFLENLNEHSTILGKLAESIALDDGASQAVASAASCAAMLSGIGSLVLLDAFADRYLEVIGSVGPDLPLHMAEEAAFGASHAHVGAYLLGLWGFADSVVEAVAHAYAPSACPVRDNHILTAVHTARGLGPRFPLLPQGIEESNRLDMGYLIDARKDGSVSRWTALAKQCL